MGYVITQYAWWIVLGAFGLGLLVGLYTWERKAQGNGLSGWLNWAAIVFLIGLFAAIFKLLAGRGGLWLETSLIMFAVYIVGCLLGSWVRGLFAAPEPMLAGVSGGGNTSARAGSGSAASAGAAGAVSAGAAGLAAAHVAARTGGAAAGTGAPGEAAAMSLSAMSPSAMSPSAMSPAAMSPAAMSPAAMSPAALGSPALAFPAAPDNAPLAIDSSRAYPGKRPAGLARPEGAQDDLTQIAGIGGSDQKILNDLGVHHVRQIAGWSPENAGWVNHHMGRPGRVEAEGWIGKAAALASGSAGGLAAAGAAVASAAGAAVAASVAGVAGPGAAAQTAAKVAGTTATVTGAVPSGIAGTVAGSGTAGAGTAIAMGGLSASGINNGGTGTETGAAVAGAGAAALLSGAAAGPVSGAGGTGPTAGTAGASTPGGASPPASNTGAGMGSAGQGSAAAATSSSGAFPVPGDIHAAHPGSRPVALTQARGGVPDDLKRIRGISPENERSLNRLGIYHHDQIAGWTPGEHEWADSFLGTPGRAERDGWSWQAKLLAQAHETQAGPVTAAGAGSTGAESAGIAASAAAAVLPSNGTSGRVNPGGPLISGGGSGSAGAVPGNMGTGSGSAAPGAGRPAEIAGNLANPGGTGASGGSSSAAGGTSGSAVAAARNTGGPSGQARASVEGAEAGQGGHGAGSPGAVGSSGAGSPALGAGGAGSSSAGAHGSTGTAGVSTSGQGLPGRASPAAGSTSAGGAATVGLLGAAVAAGATAGSPVSATATGHSASTPPRAGQAGLAGGSGAHGEGEDDDDDDDDAADHDAADDIVAGGAGDINAAHPGRRPHGLTQARHGKGDKLRRIKGLGRPKQRRLRRLGIWHFDQIAAWTPEEARWVGAYLGAPGEIESEDWIGQAQKLAAGDSGAAASGSGLAPAPVPGDLNAAHPGVRPVGLASARGGKGDDLTWINGVARVNEGKLHGLGVYHFDQIAGWNAQNAQWMSSYLKISGQVEREDWIGQCKFLASGQQTDHARRIIASELKPAVQPAPATSAAGGDGPPLTDVPANLPGTRPAGLMQARDNEPDDLLKIKGIGRSNLRQLHALGIFHFDQLGSWTKEEAAWVGGFMAFPGRIEREDWIGQSRQFAKRRAIELASRKK